MRHRIAVVLTRYDLVSLLPIATVGLLIRLYDLASKPLWYDELIAVTLSMLPMNDILINLRKIEVHPPPYYIQLNLWMLFGTSDFWIKLNSVMWNIVALFSLFYTTRSIFGKRASILATILFALSPFAMFYAQEVRPYSLLMFLGIMSWYFTHRFLSVARSLAIDLGLMASTLFFLYSHGAGFLLLPCLSSYAFFSLTENFNQWRRLLRWSLLQVVVLKFYIPWLLRARTVRMGHAAIPGWENVATTLFTVIFGYGEIIEIIWLPGWISWISLGVIALVIFTLFWDKIPRNISISFVIVPIVFSIAISYTFSPIWLPRILAFIFPFWCLSLALSLATDFFRGFIPRKKLGFLPYSIYMSFSILLLVLSAYQQQTFHWPWNIRDASKFVSANVHANDIIFIPDKRLFLAWSWYYAGPRSVNPLTTNYVLITDERVHVVSSPTINEFIGPDRTYWHVYRPHIDRGDFLSSIGRVRRELTIDFHGLTIEKVQFTGG